MLPWNLEFRILGNFNVDISHENFVEIHKVFNSTILKKVQRKQESELVMKVENIFRP